MKTEIVSPMNTYILKNDQQTGPYDDADIQRGLATGRFTYDDLAWREGLAEWQPLGALYSRLPAAQPPPMAAPVRQSTLSCQTCGQGTLTKRKTYRMSTPVVVIGYILLIPSALGVLFGIIGFFAASAASVAASGAGVSQARVKLEAKAVPEPIIAEVLAAKPVSPAEFAALSLPQKMAVNDAQITISASTIGAGAGAVIGGGLFIVLIIASFVGGLLGWVLIMKKKVLQCNRCEAVVAAS